MHVFWEFLKKHGELTFYRDVLLQLLSKLIVWHAFGYVGSLQVSILLYALSPSFVVCMYDLLRPNQIIENNA